MLKALRSRFLSLNLVLQLEFMVPALSGGCGATEEEFIVMNIINGSKTILVGFSEAQSIEQASNVQRLCPRSGRHV